MSGNQMLGDPCVICVAIINPQGSDIAHLEFLWIYRSISIFHSYTHRYRYEILSKESLIQG